MHQGQAPRKRRIMARGYPLWAVGIIGFSALLTGCGASAAAPAHVVKAPAAKAKPKPVPKESHAPVASAALRPWEQAGFTSVDFLTPNTGWVAAIKNPSNMKTIAAGLLTTRDGGRQWSVIPVKYWTGIDAIDFVSASRGWLMVSKGGTAHGTIAILHTTDGGVKWKSQWSGPYPATDLNEPLSAEARVDAVSASTAYAFTGAQILKTTNQGASWSAVALGVRGFSPVSVDMISPQEGYVAGSEGTGTHVHGVVLKTVDGGKRWSPIFQTSPADHYAPYSAAIAAAGSHHVEFLFEDETAMSTDVAISNDGGAHWTSSSVAAPQGAGYDGPVHFISKSVGMMTLSSGASPTPGGILVTHDGGVRWQESGVNRDWSMSQVDPVSTQDAWATGNQMASGAGFLLHTTNGGKTWSQAFPFPSPVTAVQFYSASSGYGVGLPSNPKTLLKTDNGGRSWSVVPTTFRDIPEGISFSSAKNGWALETTEDKIPEVMRLESTENGGKSWTTVGKVEPSATDIVPDHPYLLRLSSQMGLYQETDFPALHLSATANGGKTWTAYPPKTAAPGTWEEESWTNLTDGFLTESFPSTSKKPARIRFYKTVNAGKTWTEIREFPGVWSQGLSFANKQDGWILALSHPGTTQNHWVMMQTVNGGKTWTSHSVQGNFQPLGNSVAMQFVNIQDGWILGSQGLYRTTDGGVLWRLLS